MGINLNRVSEIESILFSDSKESTYIIKAKIIEINKMKNCQYAQLSLGFFNIICNSLLIKMGLKLAIHILALN